jgi:putative ABC transport system permease protein
MQLPPLLSAMRRNKVGVILISIQTALTLAIMCNGLFIIQGYAELTRRPSGVDEADTFAMTNAWVGHPADLAARLQTDLAMLRSLAGVVDAYATNAYPLTNIGVTDDIVLTKDQVSPTTQAAVYYADDHTIRTLGLKLIAGRNFSAADMVDYGGREEELPPVGVIITRDLADKLFPGGGALGRSIYTDSRDHSNPIIGIIDRLQTPFVSGSLRQINGNSFLAPVRNIVPYSNYVVRVEPGRLNSVMQTAQRKLFEINRARVLVKVRTLAEARIDVYRAQQGLEVTLGIVCSAMLLVTAFGIVGLTSYWVTQRRRQIGIRRALGATKSAIVRHFQTENLIIAAAGAVLGMSLAITLNLWMVSNFEMKRLNMVYPLIGAVVVLVLGQLAALWPSLRAASVPPALATRGV